MGPRTIVDADALENELRRVKRVDRRRLHRSASNQHPHERLETMECARRTRKMGCLSANFSTPPLMTDVLNVMMPAYQGTRAVEHALR